MFGCVSRRWRGGHDSAVAETRRDNLIYALKWDHGLARVIGRGELADLAAHLGVDALLRRRLVRNSARRSRRTRPRFRPKIARAPSNFSRATRGKLPRRRRAAFQARRRRRGPPKSKFRDSEQYPAPARRWLLPTSSGPDVTRSRNAGISDVVGGSLGEGTN